MDVLPLPPHPSVEQYEQRVYALVDAARSGTVRAWAEDWMQSLATSLGVTITPFVRGSIDRAVGEIERRAGKEPLTPAGAQLLIARAHAFGDWAAFSRHLTHVDEDPFERATDAIVSGDLATLESLLERDADLIRARSPRTHRATLLHYVAANGVEDFRQLTPANAVAIARKLLNAGAEVDALAETYGGGRLQTTMNLLVSSVHPAKMGVQSALAETLLDSGAAINGLDGDGSPLMTALKFGYIDAAETLARRGARIDNAIAAAALGQLEMVKRFPPHAEALSFAARFSRTSIVEYLLDAGVDPASQDVDGMTALHWASAAGAIGAMRVLISRGAPLDIRNRWGGTVLGSTTHFAHFDPAPAVDYDEVAKILMDAGATK